MGEDDAGGVGLLCVRGGLVSSGGRGSLGAWALGASGGGHGAGAVEMIWSSVLKSRVVRSRKMTMMMRTVCN